MVKKPTFQRARSDEQIELRREEILRTALQLLRERGPKGVTLISIGEGVGLSKSNLYRYFESREDVLCEVFLLESKKFVAEIKASLGSLPQKDEYSLCAILFAQACGNHSSFSTLNSQFAINLEENISVERVVEVKKQSGLLLRDAAEALHAALPSLGEDGALDAIKMFLYQLAGAWPFMHPAPTMKRAIKEAGRSEFDTDFRKSFTRVCYIILTGLIEDKKATEV